MSLRSYLAGLTSDDELEEAGGHEVDEELEPTVRAATVAQVREVRDRLDALDDTEEIAERVDDLERRVEYLTELLEPVANAALLAEHVDGMNALEAAEIPDDELAGLADRVRAARAAAGGEEP